MAQILEPQDEELVVRSDLQVPADADGPQLERTTIVVDSFLEGEQRDTIEFVLDERFRERVDAALQELLERGEGVVADPGETERDAAQAIRVDLGQSVPVFASITMKHDLFRDTQVAKIVDPTFREFA